MINYAAAGNLLNRAAILMQITANQYYAQFVGAAHARVNSRPILSARM